MNVLKPLSFVCSCVRLQKAGPDDAGQMYTVSYWACAQTGLDSLSCLASLRFAVLFGRLLSGAHRLAKTACIPMPYSLLYKNSISNWAETVLPAPPLHHEHIAWSGCLCSALDSPKDRSSTVVGMIPVQCMTRLCGCFCSLMCTCQQVCIP